MYEGVGVRLERGRKLGPVGGCAWQLYLYGPGNDIPAEDSREDQWWCLAGRVYGEWYGAELRSYKMRGRDLLVQRGSGQVTGNLVRSDNNAFIDFVTVLKPIPNNPGAWKHFISIWDKGAEALDFETLAPIGIIADVNYQLMDADVEPCTAAPPVKDLSNYLTCAQAGCPPISFSNDPSDPWVKIQIKNVSSVAVQGPIHLFIEGLPSGSAVANPDGDYLGSPFMDLVSSSLAPGQTEDVTIRFNSDRAGSIPIFRVKPVSGSF